MDLSRKVAFNTAAQIVGRGSLLLLSFLTTAILTRTLGQSGYGTFGVINTAVLMFFSLADWGTNMIAVRELAKSSSQTELILGNCLVFRAAMSLLAMAVFLIFIFLNPSFISFQGAAALASLIIFFTSLKTSAQVVFQAKFKLYLNSLVEFLTAGVFLLLLLFFPGFSLFQTILFLTSATFFSAALALFLVNRLTRATFRFDLTLVKHLLRESWSMGAVLFVFAIYNRVDTFILQAIKGEAATGVYVLAYKVHDNLVLGAAYLMNALFPVIANLSVSSPKKTVLKEVLQKGLDLLLAMALPMVILIFLFSPVIINLLGGPDFSLSAPTLRILIFATGIAYLNHLTGYSLAALGYQRTHLKFGLLALLANVLLNFLFIPRYSFLGAAAVTVFTEGLVFVLTFIYLKKVLAFRFSFKSFPRTIREVILKKGKIF